MIDADLSMDLSGLFIVANWAANCAANCAAICAVRVSSFSCTEFWSEICFEREMSCVVTLSPEVACEPARASTFAPSSAKEASCCACSVFSCSDLFSMFSIFFDIVESSVQTMETAERRSAMSCFTEATSSFTFSTWLTVHLMLSISFWPCEATEATTSCACSLASRRSDDRPCFRSHTPEAFALPLRQIMASTRFSIFTEPSRPVSWARRS
mmetsp:Transcript_11943/g.31586  ORF Transcript_11943/g.31586 Transcript_11943/m.31586 type:complete len:212 (-) Transcript_11943:1361-1996(-)